MKILYLTFYYSPDLCAGSFRNSSLSNELKNKIKKSDQIELITTLPNRYSSYNNYAKRIEKNDNLIINRIKLPKHKSGLIDQSYAFLIFFIKVLRITKGKKYDIVFASSSRLFTAFLSAIIASRNKTFLYLDIRDLFVDTIQDVLKNRIFKFFIIFFLKKIEKFTFESADHINLISEGFKDYFNKYNISNLSFYSNGIDDIFLKRNQSKTLKNRVKVITYAGNIGEGQGLHKIIPELATRLGKNFLFRIIGDGGLRIKLENSLKKYNCNNVELINPVNREKLIEYYKNSDYLFLHLNNHNAFKKVLPSKIFDYAAFNKPIIAGVSGFASLFIKKHIKNALVFNPLDSDFFVSNLNSLEINGPLRTSFIKRFSRKEINSKMANSILNNFIN